jgi:hypothetical protein
MKVWFLLNTFALKCFATLFSTFNFVSFSLRWLFLSFWHFFSSQKKVNLFSRLRKFEYVSYIFASDKHMFLLLQKRQRLSYLRYLKSCYVQTDTVHTRMSYILYICCIMSWGVTAAGLSCSCSQWPAFQGAVKALAVAYLRRDSLRGKNSPLCRIEKFRKLNFTERTNWKVIKIGFPIYVTKGQTAIGTGCRNFIGINYRTHT